MFKKKCDCYDCPGYDNSEPISELQMVPDRLIERALATKGYTEDEVRGAVTSFREKSRYHASCYESRVREFERLLQTEEGRAARRRKDRHKKFVQSVRARYTNGDSKAVRRRLNRKR